MNLNEPQNPQLNIGAVNTRLTPAQKRALELLKINGGSCHVYSYRLLKIFYTLQDKGLVKCESAVGQFQKGTTVSLNVC